MKPFSMKPPISMHWASLNLRQAWMLVISALALELPIRWIVRPDMASLIPGNPWFNLPLRIAIETGMILVFIAVPLLTKAPLPAVGIPRRRWTRWEWGALAIIGGVELVVVIILAGNRWPRIWAGGLMGEGLLWAFSEFLFGCNQETGFRGMMMTGWLRIAGWKWAFALNTLLFLIGPLHGPGLVEWIGKNPIAAAGYAVGVIVHGVAFSWLRHRTDNVILCAVLHGIINGFMNGSGLTLRANSSY
ncbi:MAG: CPBP family intramembrane glutamic endopeptidase [Bacteroidota bacterium]